MPTTVQARVEVCSECGGTGGEKVDEVQGKEVRENCPSCDGAKVHIDFSEEAMQKINALVDEHRSE